MGVRGREGEGIAGGAGKMREEVETPGVSWEGRIGGKGMDK